MQAYIKAIEPVNVDWTKNVCLKIFFAGCDFKCPFCNTPHLLETREEFLIDLRDVKKEIDLNSGFAEAVIFTGGEPCLQRPQLIELAKQCREKKIKIGIETNGSKPEVLHSLLKENLLDFIALDIKTPFNEELFERLTKSRTFFITTNQVIQNLKATIELLIENKDKLEIEIRTTIIPSLLYRKEDILEIANIVNQLNARWVFQKFDNMAELASKNLQSINPPSLSFLEDIKEACIKQYPQLRIEIK
ncbi:anaerobic ribonucleoside-triphosphate reductase activating protein [Candidatus Woesearchaeota archaeon]|jgi:pyruvate formate lyase activating enzyme|nr:anaerobic ribonucleoside-triphosphate reductase activating protein [Candidatus Woesearchaeota archaeon]